MTKIDFTKETPMFDNGHCKWFIEKHFQNYLENEQADNLPKLKDLWCFIVKGPDIEDYVLIDGKQNILASFKYTQEGFGQMEARINIIKVSKHYDDHEPNI
jgi:hypothetical protein